MFRNSFVHLLDLPPEMANAIGMLGVQGCQVWAVVVVVVGGANLTREVEVQSGGFIRPLDLPPEMASALLIIP